MDSWKPLYRLASEIGIPEASVRRYALTQFPEFIKVQRQGRVNLVAPDSIPVLKKIHALFAQGLGKDRVAEALAKEFGRPTQRADEVAANDPVMPATLETSQPLALLAEAFQALADHKREVDELRADNRQLRERLDRLEASLTAGPRPENATQAHPDEKADLNPIESPAIPWWAFWR